MPSDKYDLLGRVKAVEREHTALRFTTDHALRSLGEGGVELEEELKRLDVYRASERLEGTYIIRLFSEFEVALARFARALHTAIKKGRGAHTFSCGRRCPAGADEGMRCAPWPAKCPHPAVPARPRKRGSPRSPREKERRGGPAASATQR